MAKLDIGDLQACHWETGFDKVNFQSEANQHFMGSARRGVLHEANRNRKKAESLELGKVLRRSHIQFSHHSGVDYRSEAKKRFVERDKPAFAAAVDPGLRKTHIDFAAGADKSCRGWITTTSASMPRDRILPLPDAGAQEEKALLRKSSIPIFPGQEIPGTRSVPKYMSTSQSQFIPKTVDASFNYSGTLGKDLRCSHIDLSLQSKTGKHWQSEAISAMNRESDKKWACRQPEGFERLGKELRKTNITLGTHRVDYGTGRRG